MKAVGIDIGTTTISAVVLDGESRKAVESVTVQNGSFIHRNQDWERVQDVSMIINKSRGVLDGLLDRYTDIGSIGLTGQMHGIVYLNDDGKCVSPLYTWQDGRGNLAEFDGKSMAEMVSAICGVPSAAGYGLITHLYNQKRNLVPPGSVSFCTIGDYLGMELTGRKNPLVHISNAASMGLFDCRRYEFMTEALLAMGVDVSMLPQVTREVSVLGSYRGIPVTAALGDNQASFLGSAGLTEGAVLLNMGTGGQISVFSNQYFQAPGIETRPLTGGHYLLAGSSLCGGRAYAILEKFFRSYAAAAGGADVPQYDLMAELARKGAAGTDLLQVKTTFYGTRVDPGLRGSISNISEDNFTPESMVYGVLQGMARELYDLFEKIQEGTGITADHLVASGNGLRKNIVLQEIFRQMFRADLTLAPYEEEAAAGAAISSFGAF